MTDIGSGITGKLARLIGVGLALATLALVGCAPDHPIVMECADAQGIHAICGMQNPEDLALLPDGRTVVVSQFGLMDGSQAGNLAFFDLDRETVEIAYAGGTTAARLPTAGWGDPECPGPPDADFSPHGIDLAPRPDGRLRLLVVNHGGRESIEFFEVTATPAGPELSWRGCVIPPGEAYLNDVVSLPDGGLLATHMFPRGGEALGLLRGALGMDTGHVLEWRAGGRWREVAGSEAPFPNGIELSEDGRSIYLNAYMADEVRRIDRESGEVLGVARVSSPDNSSWGPDGRLLVASHLGGLRDQTACYGLVEGACPMRFRIVAVDPESMATETLIEHAGPPMGAGTIALDLGDELLIGTFAGDRMIRVPRRP